MSFEKRRLVASFISALIILSIVASCFSVSSIKAEILADPDDDNDGVPNSEDICIDGNGIVILSIDYFESLDVTDFGSECDAYFDIAIDGNCNWAIEENEIFNSEKFYFQDSDIVADQGYGKGELWHGVDVPDDTTEILFFIIAYDRDLLSDNELDISSNSNRYHSTFGWQIQPSGTIVSDFDDGSLDGNSNEDDAYIEFHIEVIKGTTIELVRPTPYNWSNGADEANNWVYIDEGSNTTFSVTDYYVPSTIPNTIGCEWYISQAEDGEWGNWTCVQRYFCDKNQTVDPNTTDPLSYDIYANYGSAGQYLLAVCLFSDWLAERSIYWYDLEFWLIEIVHKNEIPVAIISNDSATIRQMDRVSFSGLESYDIDGDAIEYTWTVDGEDVGHDIDLNWVFIDAGYHDISLTVSDDENATDTDTLSVFVDNIILPDDPTTGGTVTDEGTIIVPNNYVVNSTTRTSTVEMIPVILGWNLKISISLVERTQLVHDGSVEYYFSIDNRTVISRLEGTTDTFTLTYLPSIEVLAELIKGDERLELLSAEIPVPLLSNEEGLDGNGVGFDIISFSQTSNSSDMLTIYTWDNPALILDHVDMQDVIGEKTLGSKGIEIANVDIFKLAEVVCQKIPTQVTLGLGKVFNIVDYFANLFFICDLMTDVSIDQEFYLLIEEEGAPYVIIETMPSFTMKELDMHYNARVFQMSCIELTLDLHLEAYLKMKLTEAGARLYAFINEVLDNGLVIAIWDTLMDFILCDDIVLEDTCWTHTLWAQGEVTALTDIDSHIDTSFSSYIVDQDRDSYWDIDDYYPLDPTRHMDDVPPTVEVSPAGSGIALGTVIVAEFSEAMNKSSVVISIQGVSGTISWDGNTATFTPTALGYNGDYTATVYGKDIAGNTVEHSWTFNTTKVGNVEGYLVDDEGNVLVGVLVCLSNGMSMVTDSSGHFLFEHVELGDYSLIVDIDSYQGYTADVNVEAAETIHMGNIVMVSLDTDDGSDNDPSSLPLMIGIVGFAVIIGGAGFFVYKRKKR